MSSADESNPRKPGRGDRSRFGPSAVVREGPPSGDAHQLSFFVDGDGLVVEDRRSSPRYQAVEHRAWLGWWIRPGEFGSVAAHLEDISLGGAKLVTANPPAAQQLVWLCVGIPDPTECVQAKVLQVRPRYRRRLHRPARVRIPCPQNLYQTAIYGILKRGDDGLRRDLCVSPTLRSGHLRGDRDHLGVGPGLDRIGRG